MSEEADPVAEKIGCGARLGMLLLIAAILAVIFFLLINPMLISRDIDLLGKLKLRGIFTRQTTAGESVAVQEENQAPDEFELNETNAMESNDPTGENISGQTPQPVQVIDPDGNVQNNSSDSWY